MKNIINKTDQSILRLLKLYDKEISSIKVAIDTVIFEDCKITIKDERWNTLLELDESPTEDSIAPHIELLLKVSKSNKNIQWNRVSENVLSISCCGYIHQDLMDLEESLLKLGLKYDFTYVRENVGAQYFDKISGRTYTYMKEPIK